MKQKSNTPVQMYVFGGVTMVPWRFNHSKTCTYIIEVFVE